MITISHLRFLMFSLMLFAISNTIFSKDIESQLNENSFSELEVGKKKVLILSISGKISKILLDKLEIINNHLATKNISYPTLLVLLDSSGGDADAAIKIGRIFRKHHAHILITKYCASACVFAYSGGSIRISPPYSLGTHLPRVTLSDRYSRVIKELDTEQNFRAKKLLEDFNSNLINFLSEMNINNSFYSFMNEQSRKIRWLSEDEADRYNLNGWTIENKNLNFEDLNYLYIQLRRKVVTECIQPSNGDRKLIQDCYISALIEMNII